MSHTAKSRRTAQRHTEPIDSPKPTTGHCAALQRDEIRLHQLEHSHKLPQPGKHHRTLIQPIHGAVSTTKNYNLENFFSLKITLFIPLTYFCLHISLLWCWGVFLFFLLKRKILFKIFFLFHPFLCVCVCSSSDFVFDIFDRFSYGSLPAVAISEYI